MPLAFSDVKKTFINFITDSNVWNGLISNAFSIGMIVSIIILLILVLSYDESKSTTKNMISFVLYSSIFTIIMFVLHDSVLIHNYKIKNSNELEKKVISGNFNSNNPNAQFFGDIQPIDRSNSFNGAGENHSSQMNSSQMNSSQMNSSVVVPVSQSTPIPNDAGLLNPVRF
jgi:hypothetical protein